MEVFSTGESPRGGAARVGAEAGGVTLVAHVTNEEFFVRVLLLKAGFKESMLHHTRPQSVANEDDAGAFFKFERFGLRGSCEGE